MAKRNVLLIGASGSVYSESGRAMTLPVLLESELNAGGADTWACVQRPLFYGERMASRASKLYEEIKPDVVVLHLVAKPFLEDVPIARVRRLLPALYPAARRIADWLKVRAAGEDPGGLRGQIYRLPRALVAFALGAEPEVPVADAIRYTVDTMDAVLRHEDVSIICRKPISMLMATGVLRDERYRARLRTFNQAVGDYCRRKHLPFYDREAEMGHDGRFVARSVDGQHPDLSSRTFEARLLASLIRKATERPAESNDAAGPPLPGSPPALRPHAHP